MSFKRDGNDKGALDNQRKRRVADLLFEDIQEEEVTRLSNGKYKCKMCSSQPIFDTLNMFYVHKQGKKHLYSIEYAAQQKQELDDLIEKRKHEQMVRDGNAVTKQVVEETEIHQEYKNPILGIKKPRKLYERKAVLDLNISNMNKSNTTTTIAPIPTVATCANQLPGNRFNNTFSSKQHKYCPETVQVCTSASSSTTNNSRYSGSPDIAADRKFRSSFQHKQQSSVKHGEKNTIVNAMNVGKFVRNSNAEQNNKYYLSRKKDKEETRSLIKKIDDNSSSQTLVSPAQTWEFYKDFKGKVPFKMKSKEEPVNKSSEGTEELQKIQNGGNTEIKTVQTASGTSLGKEHAEKYLHALGSGWKKDWTGTWIKDENAEFDSDDEPPDIQ
ncbi:uncharacterized protein LOC132728340 [Ruditapes philippinarum]|uniref:uncharacterized protein LOC132728340 n=1 Tax=Ruditapes philippinarum TaxID=129788 RepID=UPI00295C3941|nr:uncharacterized protein LOC132728340 [Ruditapes philippinarum]XP_060569980.1 uncharacterized protein LOC132728340 [Ruditapes philippinarum]